LYKACALIELGKGSITPQDLLERAQIFRQTLAFITDPSTSTIIMDGLCRMGRYEEALAESSIGLSTAERGQISVMVPEILRFRGDVLVQLGQLQGADQSYQDAVHSAKQQGAVSLELRALTSLLQFRYQQNLSLEESTRLQELLDLLKNEPLTDDIQSARVLLKQFY
jgi:predicted negative regulator of RcsB-dependent stress response